MHYYNFHIGDYKAHTSHLSPTEDIIYRRLLDLYYMGEQPLLTGVKVVARLIGMPDHYQEVEVILGEFFTLADNGWINKRADIEIAVYKGFSDAGKRGAAKRWGTGGDSPPIAPLIATENQEPRTENREPLKDSPATGVAYTPAFLTFWDMYPKKRAINF